MPFNIKLIMCRLINHLLTQYFLLFLSPHFSQMDFPVEATVHLKFFSNQSEVRDILRSHGFTLSDLPNNRVLVKGYFTKLGTVKARLEQLVYSQTQTRTTPLSCLPVQKHSAGARSKQYTNYSSVPGYTDKPTHGSPFSSTTSSVLMSGSYDVRPTSPQNRDASSLRPDQQSSRRSAGESFVVDCDVFNYAWRLRKKDINVILDSHDVRLEKHQVGDSFNINLRGKSAGTAISKLQSLLNELNRTLRTQEVALEDMNKDGQALLERIRKSKDIYNSVLVCQMGDRLHLIGPSSESYELKQRLFGRPDEQSGRRGRNWDRNSQRRSGSLPPQTRHVTGGDKDTNRYPSPVKSRGYSPSRYQNTKEEGTNPKRGATALHQVGGSMRRSHSVSREKVGAQNEIGSAQENNKKISPTQKMKKAISQVTPLNIRQMMKDMKYRK